MLDGLLKKQVRGDTQVEGMLTSYNGKPAFFYQKSPPDSDDRWGGACYPRADYNIDTLYSPERKSSGILTINIWCVSGNSAMPEDIEKRLRELIEGTFYNFPKKASVCAVWARSDAFSFEVSPNNSTANGQPEVFGITMLFELMEFPFQITAAPDPIQGINEWTKKYFSGLTVIGYDSLPPVWKPTDKDAAVYWRFIDYDTDDRRGGYAVDWFIGNFAAHVITDSVQERNRWLKSMAERLRIDGEIVLQDGSPMFIKKVDVKHNADSLRDGQMIISGQYGVLSGHRKEQAEIILNNVNFNGGDKMSKTTGTKDKGKEESALSKASNNTIYAAEELAGAARRVFHTTPEIVKTALKRAGKTKATIEETKNIVSKFLSKEVVI